MDDDFDPDSEYLDEHSPIELWRDFAVSRGFKRAIVEAMSKPELIECLNRLESVDDSTVR